MIRVLLVDDQRLFIEGLQAILSQEEDIEVAGLFSDGLEMLDHIEALKPDIILMDIHMPQTNGIEATFQVKRAFPHVKVILLTAFAEEELILYGINAGADGFLLKELERTQLIQAIRDVSFNEVVISGEAAKTLVKKVRDIKFDKREILNERLENQHIYLTKRELDIANYLIDGVTNKFISQKLDLSEGTIKNYISDLYSKVNIHNRGEMIEYLRELIK